MAQQVDEAVRCILILPSPRSAGPRQRKINVNRTNMSAGNTLTLCWVTFSQIMRLPVTHHSHMQLCSVLCVGSGCAVLAMCLRVFRMIACIVTLRLLKSNWNAIFVSIVWNPCVIVGWLAKIKCICCLLWQVNMGEWQDFESRSAALKNEKIGLLKKHNTVLA